MKDILDDEFGEKEEQNELTSNIKLRAFLYISIMLIGGFFYMKYFSIYGYTLFNCIYGSFILIMLFLIFGTVVKLIQYYYQKWKDQKTGIQKKYDPLWFQIIESGFSFWIIIAFFSIITQLV